MERFSGSTAVITGAGSGIGEATAKRLAAEGARLLLVGRTRSKLEKVAEEINGQYGDSCADVYSADVTKEEEVKGLAQKVKSSFDNLHVLINNAGGSTHSSVFETSAADWDFVQEVNLKSVFLVSRALGELMKETASKNSGERQNAAIVNTASLSAHQAGAKIPHYSAAKAGVVSLTKSLALDLAP
ncbi:MAG TPA: SDR family oxidoreductase [Bacillales bacterium]|nr:SDR family oxidoreductase [Bacillales bacterium]